LVRDGEEELIMSAVDIVRPEDGCIYIRDVFGEQRWVKGHIKEMTLVDHRIVFEEDKSGGVIC
jgi:predicted RNA-binding protein